MSNGSLKNSFPSPSPSQAEVDAFVFAAGMGDMAAIRFFLDKYPSAVDSKSASGNPAVTWAAAQGQKEVVKLLLQAKASVEARDKNGRTPLIAAAWGEFGADKRGKLAETIDLLLARGANVGARDNAGWTALMRAAWKGRCAIVSRLWEGGADINARSKSGLTPLMLAATMGNSQTVSFLLEKGADAGAKDDNGKTARMMAFERGYHGPADLIEQWDNLQKRQNGMDAARLQRLKDLRPQQPPFGNRRK